MSTIENIVHFLLCIREAKLSTILYIHQILLDLKKVSFNFIPDAINSGHFKLFFFIKPQNLSGFNYRFSYSKIVKLGWLVFKTYANPVPFQTMFTFLKVSIRCIFIQSKTILTGKFNALSHHKKKQFFKT